MGFTNWVAKYWWIPFAVSLVSCLADCIVSVYSFPEYFFPRVIDSIVVLSFFLQLTAG